MPAAVHALAALLRRPSVSSVTKIGLRIGLNLHCAGLWLVLQPRQRRSIRGHARDVKGEQVIFEVNVHKRTTGKLAALETVATPEELHERLKRQHAASLVKLGARLLELELITRDELDRALEVQRTDSTRHLGQVLTDFGYIAEAHLSQILCEQLGIPFVDLERFPIDPGVLSLVPEKAARSNHMLPLCCIDGELVVAMSDPLDTRVLEQARFCAERGVIPVLAHRGAIDRAIRAYYQYAVFAFEWIRFEHPRSVQEVSVSHTPRSGPLTASRAPVQVAVVGSVVSPEQLRERLRRQRATAMLKLGARLIELELITPDQLEQALRLQRHDSRRRIGQVLFDLGYILDAHLNQVVCEQLGIAFVALEHFPIDHDVLRLLPERSVRTFRMLPLCCIEAQLVVAMPDPLSTEAIEHARFCAQLPVIPAMALRYELEQAITTVYGKPFIWFGDAPRRPARSGEPRH
jgi:hypothetical protein